jgi:hypothetical protein
MIIDTGSGSDEDVTLSKDSACASVEVQAERLPLDLYFMVDRSASMDGSPWTAQSNALKGFFNNTANAGLFAALRFFPLDDKASPQDSSCSGKKYANPLVNWAQLPSSALVSAISSTSADGSFTPTQEALNGVLQGAKTRQLAEPLHAVVAVIVSDGEPCCQSCPVEDAAGLGNIAATYANGTPSIKTFAIYVASQATAVLTSIAKNGGTTKAYDATGGQAAFSAALEAIRGAALSCEYKMPTSDGGKIDPNYLTVDYKSSPTATGQSVSHKKDISSCDSGLGWYYDNNTSPQKITLCPATCKTMQASSSASVEILVSCTEIPPI